MGEIQKYDFIPDYHRDTQFDYDYTDVKDSGYARGGRSFNRPNGWKKVALKVTGKYENDQWFGKEGRKNDQSSLDDEWPVSYHGPKDHWNIPNILNNGYDISKNERAQYGKGIYSSPNPTTAEKFAQTFVHSGKKIKAMFMNRVNMSYTKVADKGNIYVTTNDRMIRPIAVLIKEV